jgi:hypothetical protein
MATFGSIYARMVTEQGDGAPLLAADTATEDDSAMVDAFRRGLHLRSDKESDATFWNELRQMSCENRKGLAKLLQVSPNIISRWPAVIDKYMSVANQLDAHENGLKKPKVLNTGDGTQKPAVGMQGDFGDTNAPRQGPF